jgi:hypothetical protein
MSGVVVLGGCCVCVPYIGVAFLRAADPRAEKLKMRNQFGSVWREYKIGFRSSGDFKIAISCKHCSCQCKHWQQPLEFVFAPICNSSTQLNPSPEHGIGAATSVASHPTPIRLSPLLSSRKSVPFLPICLACVI